MLGVEVIDCLGKFVCDTRVRERELFVLGEPSSKVNA